MKVSARVEISHGTHIATVATNGNAREVAIPGRELGFGSSVNGGELLFLALATCYGNDIYREAARRGVEVQAVSTL